MKRIPKKCKPGKLSKYVPVYLVFPSWEQIYRHWMWPYEVVEKKITFLKG